MNYPEAIQYMKDLTKFGIKLGLERIAEILRRLGDPQDQYPVIHIAGTNGKGSTTAMLESVLREAGYKIGKFTSPHLSSYRERFTVDGTPIGKSELAEMISGLQPVLEAVSGDGYGEPTEFEVHTAIAFTYFARQNVDVALIEVGMGGRFDATNVVNPVLSIITHIALDHQQYLGDTLEKIAFEKAGIIKPDAPVVIGVQEPAITAYLKKIAAERKSPVYLAEEVRVRDIVISEDGTQFTALHPSLGGELPVDIGLIGRHQVQNALNVLTAWEILQRSGFAIDCSTLLNGMKKSQWPGRMELVQKTDSFRLFLDGAHNPDGWRALAGNIQELYPGQKVTLLIGVLNNRPLGDMAAILAPLTEQAIVTRVPDPKSASLEDLATCFEALGVPVQVEPEPDQALRNLLQTGRGILIVTGSLYLIGLLRSKLFGIED